MVTVEQAHLDALEALVQDSEGRARESHRRSSVQPDYVLWAQGELVRDSKRPRTNETWMPSAGLAAVPRWPTR
eukprot:4820883-Amphidinium_carterae.1